MCATTASGCTPLSFRDASASGTPPSHRARIETFRGTVAPVTHGDMGGGETIDTGRHRRLRDQVRPPGAGRCWRRSPGSHAEGRATRARHQWPHRGGRGGPWLGRRRWDPRARAGRGVSAPLTIRDNLNPHRQQRPTRDARTEPQARFAHPTAVKYAAEMIGTLFLVFTHRYRGSQRSPLAPGDRGHPDGDGLRRRAHLRRSLQPRR